MSDSLFESFPERPDLRETRVRVPGARETRVLSHATQELPAPWKQGEQHGDFLIDELLGKGSSGYVYRAFDSVSHKHCALKVITERDPLNLVRIKLGFRRMMHVKHANLLGVSLIHQIGDYTCLSMDEVRGVTFVQYARQLATRQPEDGLKALLRLTRDYGAALSQMHSVGLVHRDIKPDNLMVDESGSGVLIDFGMVGTIDPDTDPNGFRKYIAGAPFYNAPEVLFRQFHLPASDIFSLGLVILEATQLLIGKPVVKRDHSNERLDSNLVKSAIGDLQDLIPEPPTDARDQRESIAEILSEACENMLESDPSERLTAARVANLGRKNQTVVLHNHVEETIGRDAERDVIREWVLSICQGGTGRLHVHGDMGIGKSTLVNEVLREVSARKWTQVYLGQCSKRENQSLQAFGQIADAVVNRYARGDMEPLRIDPPSTQILHHAFPILKSVVHASTEYIPPDRLTAGTDALEAVSRMSVEMRKHGPMLVVIDDAQWADPDSLSVIDRLQTAPGGFLGVITIARGQQVDLQVVPSKVMHVKPLHKKSSRQILRSAATRHKTQLGASEIEVLAEAAAGNPARLLDIAEEFKPGGLIPEAIGNLSDGASVSRITKARYLWQARLERLTQEAKHMAMFIAIAQRPVSADQLSELTEAGVFVDSRISELIKQRLVSDDATGGECIQIANDAIADELIHQIKRDGDLFQVMHQRWATCLIRNPESANQSSRIATHLLNAGDSAQAIRYGRIAAQDAEERYSFFEAAVWHEKLIDLASDKHRAGHIRAAARNFNEANLPAEAAKYFRMLTYDDTVSKTEQFESKLTSLALMIQTGRYDDVHEELIVLAKQLKIPRPKGRVMATASILWKILNLTARGKTLKVTPDQISGEVVELSSSDPEVRLARQRLEFCIALAQPLSMINSNYSAEVNLTAATLARAYGTPYQKAHVLTGECVFSMYNSGKGQARGERLLAEMHDHVMESADPHAIGDWWSGRAMGYMLAGQWRELIEPANRKQSPVLKSIKTYLLADRPNGFGIAHTRFVEPWGQFYLGRVQWLVETVADAYDGALHRRDLLAQNMAADGMGAIHWIARDAVDDYKRMPHLARRSSSQHTPQVMDFFRWLGDTHCALYDGQHERVVEEIRQKRFSLSRGPEVKLQFARIVNHHVQSLAFLHHFAATRTLNSKRQVLIRVRKLRRENTGFSNVAADQLEGLLRLHGGQFVEAVEIMQRVVVAAQKQELRPFECAAIDSIKAAELALQIDSSDSELAHLKFSDGTMLVDYEQGQLIQLLQSESVVLPEKFTRLYSSVPSPADFIRKYFASATDQ